MARQTPEFKRQRFSWLDHQVLVDPELPASAFKVAYCLAQAFNDTQSDGRAWMSCEGIADAIAMSKKSVITMVRRLQAHGHLRVEWGRQGRGHPNNYWMILKGQQADLSDEIKGASTHLSDDEIKGASTSIKGASTHLNHSKNQGRAIGEPLGERDGGSAAAASGEPLAGPPRQQRRKEEGGRDPDPLLATLRTVWDRKAHATTDSAPAAVRAEQQALDDALQGGVAFEAIEAAARLCAAAYDPEHNGRRFLPALSTWLRARGWEKPPPNRKPSKRENGHGHHWPRKPKNTSNLFFKAAGVERGADGVMREIKGRTH